MRLKNFEVHKFNLETNQWEFRFYARSTSEKRLKHVLWFFRDWIKDQVRCVETDVFKGYRADN